MLSLCLKICSEKKRNIEEIHENVNMNDSLIAIRRIFGKINSLGDESKELKKQLPLLNQLLKAIKYIFVVMS